MKKKTNDVSKKIFNRIYYLLNKDRYVKKGKYRIGMKRYTNSPFIGKLKIYHGDFLLTFD